MARPIPTSSTPPPSDYEEPAKCQKLEWFVQDTIRIDAGPLGGVSRPESGPDEQQYSNHDQSCHLIIPFPSPSDFSKRGARQG